MHETIISRNIIEEASKQGKVKGIVVEVGELGYLPGYELEPTLKTLVDWDVKIIERKAVVSCSCGFKGGPKILQRGHDMCLFECPNCGKVPKILEGDQIRLISVEVE